MTANKYERGVNRSYAADSDISTYSHYLMALIGTNRMAFGAIFSTHWPMHHANNYRLYLKADFFIGKYICPITFVVQSNFCYSIQPPVTTNNAPLRLATAVKQR